MTRPYSFFKNPSGIYYVQFRLPDGRRSTSKSTGSRSCLEAERIAMEWVVNGNIPTRTNAKEEKSTSVDSLDVINKLRTTIFSDSDIKSIIKVLKDRGYISSAIISKSPETKSMNDFLLEFWDFERSPYIKEKKLKGQSIHRSYCETMRSRVMIYWLPKIGNRMVGSITRDDVKKIFDDENVLKLAPKTINSIVSSLIIPMKWALYNDLTEINCFDGIIKCSIKSKTRTILTLEQAAAVFSTSWENDSAKLANELAFYTGMRQGEIAALQVQDIGVDRIYIRHSWSKYDGLKETKTNECREIKIPTKLREALIFQASLNPHNEGLKGFIFFGLKPSQPTDPKNWLKYLHRALESIGYSNPKEICFHAWRHLWCSRVRGKMQLAAYTVTYTVTITTTSNSPRQNSDGSWQTASGGSVTFNNGEDPHSPSSYEGMGGIPTTTTSRTETRTMEIPGDKPNSKQITAAIQQETDRILAEEQKNAQNNSTKGEENKTAGEETIRVTVSITDRNNENARIIAQSDNATEAGDPVLVTSGQYVQNEKDMIVKIGTMTVELGRRYRLDKNLGDSLGSAWFHSLDSRIVWGLKPQAQEEADELARLTSDTRRLLEETRQNLERMQEHYTCELERSHKKLIELHNQQQQLNSINDNGGISGGNGMPIGTARQLTSENISFYTNYIADMEQTRPSNVAEIEERILQLERNLADLEATLTRSLQELEHRKVNERLSANAVRGWGFSENQETGNGTVAVYDMEGKMHLYRLAESPVYGQGDNHYPNGSKAESVIEGENSRLELESDGSFRWLHSDGSIWKYAQDGMLEQIQDRNGNLMQIVYDTNRRAIAIQGNRLPMLRIIWNNGRLVFIENQRDAKDRVEYGYKGNYLSYVVDTDEDKVSMSYDTEGRLTSLHKPDGSNIIFTHGLEGIDGSALTTATTNEEGYTETFLYNTTNRTTTYTSHSGEVTTYLYDSNHRTIRQVDPDGSVTAWQYDSRGNATVVTVNGDTTVHSYDDAGNLTATTYSDGSREQWNYDQYGLPILYIDRDGVTEQWRRDDRGNATTYLKGGKTVWTATYDNHGFVVNYTVYGGSTVSTDYSYDQWGNMINRITGGISETWEYDERNRVILYKVDDAVQATYTYTAKSATETLYNGLERVYIWNSRKDLIAIKETDLITGEHRVTEWQYDRRHLPVRQYTGDGSTRRLTTQWRYLPGGELEAELIQDDKQGWLTTYTYRSGQVHTVSRCKVEPAPSDLSAVKLSDLEASATEVYRETYSKTVATGNRITMTHTDPLGRQISTVYDSWMRPTIITNALGEMSTRSMTPAGRLRQEQSAHGGHYQYQWDIAGTMTSAGELGKTAVRATYNPDGTVATVTNRLGETTGYGYNSRGLVETVVAPDRKEWYKYDNVGRVISVVLGDTASIASAQRYTEYCYSSDNRIITVTEGGLYTTTYQLNGWGNVVKSSDGEGNTTGYKYDSMGRVIGSTDGYGRVTNYTRNALGLVEAVIHPDGTFIRYQYDHLGNVTKVTDSLGTVAVYTYDKAGRLIVERSRPGVDRSYTYDELDRITAIYSGGQLVERHSYTERGRTVTVIDGKGENYVYRKDEFGRLVEEQNRLGGTQVYTYDGEGRLQTKRDFNGSTTTIEYTAGGTTKTIRYATGTAETLRYDMAGQLVRATGSSGTLGYEYDRGGRLVRQHDEATGETVTYAYDKAGRRILMVGAGRETAYRYGRNGELLEVRDNRQRLSVAYKYDVMGRETERIFGNGVSQHTAYDKAGRVILITEKSGNNILLRGEGYVYDSLGRRSATVSHTGAVTRYEYNLAGELAKVQYPESQELRDLQEKEARQHGLFWQEGVSGLSNGHLSTGEYTELSRLFVWMRNGSGFLPTTQVFRTESYTYDANGNRATKTTAYGTITYSYDAENRLVKTCGNTGVGVEYAYDNNGNLLSQTSSLKHSIYEYSPQNRMVRARVVDDEARTIASTRYGYDPLGRRTLVQDNNTTTLRTLYDGLGFDVVKESPVYSSGGFVDTYNTGIQYSPAGYATGERYRYLDDGQGTSEKYQYIEDSSYQTVSSRYTGERTMLYANGSPVAINRSSGTRGYLGTDILGSTRSVTDNHGVQESYYDYDIFGSPITGDYTTGTDYGYLGKPYDSITGLYNYGYRDYSPQTVRFTTVDPIRDGANWFAYVNNDPVNYVDLLGLLSSEPKRGFWSKALDGVQAGLDVVGFVPGVGEIADGINALISLGRGDYVGATLSAISMVPVVGDALGKGGKIARAAIKHGDEVLEAGTKLLDDVDNAINAAKRHTPDEQALSSLAKEAKRNGITTQEADILLEWGREIDPNDTKGLKGRDDRDSVHWKGGSHIHVGGQDHIPVNK